MYDLIKYNIPYNAYYALQYSCVLPKWLTSSTEHRAAKLIQRAYRKMCFCNPRRKLCQERLEREFYELVKMSG